jgi:flavin-dependent dehydrogenase
LDVVVLDKAAFPRDKVCAGWITPAVVDELALDLNDYRSRHTLQPITGFRTGLFGRRQIETSYDRVVSYGIRRCEFDSYLLQRSAARLRLGEPLDDLRREGAQWVVNGSIRTPLLVGAGGHFCPVAKRLSSDDGQASAVVLAQEIEFEMSPHEASQCRVAGEIPELFFCDDLRGYGWCFRKQNFLNIGMGREGDSQLAAKVVSFCKILQDEGRIPAGVQARFRGHAYRLYPGRPRRIVADGALLIGDSAGLAGPQSGEGIRPAIESGLLAATEIVAAAGDYRQSSLARFETRIADRFGSPTKAVRRPWLPEAWRSAVGRLFLATHWFTRHIVIDRWFLHSHQPSLAWPRKERTDHHGNTCTSSASNGRDRVKSRTRSSG